MSIFRGVDIRLFCFSSLLDVILRVVNIRVRFVIGMIKCCHTFQVKIDMPTTSTIIIIIIDFQILIINIFVEQAAHNLHGISVY